MADLEKLNKQEVLELCTSVAIQLIAGVFRAAGVPPQQALKFLIKAAGLTETEIQNIDIFLTGYATDLGKTPEELTTLDVMSAIFMKMVEKRLEPPKTPENFGSSIEIVESVLPPVEVPEEKHEYNC